MQFFGDNEIFAIRYRPYERLLNDDAIAYCHFVLGGHLIGEIEEPCLLGTWTMFVKDLLNHVEINRGNLSNQLFTGLTDREIFELIYKSNQLEEDFDPAFDYLATQPSEELWSMHHITLDETIDAYRIVLIEDGENLKFIWECWRDPCPSNEIGQLYSVTVGHSLFISTVDSCLSFLRTAYPEI
jgi:hypothetical protein